MYLKSIEVQGFKSFANKIVFDFHNGITGIVGPNGSGKSNVADAVRWVLGEQRAKQLRGGSMQDVIFSGTENRKPLSYASVAITLDNTDHQLAIDFQEVTVTRKLYRSGESEYLINGSICRLKDVNELFYDTGIGKEGYSIIGQGQIDKILSGKPEERRELFDEAAGIVKFKKRKNMSVKKLEEETQNLLRVTDILSELEKQIGPLEKQSEKAKEYLKKKEELKTYDINLFLLESVRMREQIQEVEKQLANAQEEFCSAQTKYDNTKTEYEEIEGQLEKIDDTMERTKNQLNETHLLKQQLEGQIDLLKEQINSAKMSDEHFAQRSSHIYEEIEERKKQREEYLKEQETLQEQLDTQKRIENEISSRLTEIQLRITELTANVEQWKQDIMDVLNHRAVTKAKMQHFDTLLEQVRVRKAEMNKKLIEISSDVSVQDESIQRYEQELKGITEEIQGYAIEVKEQEEKIEILQKTLAKQTEQLRAGQTAYHREASRLESLKNITERYDGYGNSIRKVMEKKKQEKGLLGVVADLIKVDKKYEIAIETALGGNIQNIVTDSEDTAKRMIQYLKQNKFGRATFLPLTSITAGGSIRYPEALKESGVIGLANTLVTVEDKFHVLADSLLGRTIVVEKIDDGISLARKYRQSLRIVTIEGELINPGGAMTGGAFKNTSNLLGRRREIEEFEKTVVQLQKEMISMEAEIAEAKRERTGCYEKIEETKQQLQKKYVIQNTLKMNLNQANTEKENILKMTGDMHREGKELEEQVAELLENQESIQIELDTSENMEAELNKKIEEQQALLEKEKNSENETMQKAENIHLALANLEQKNEFILENLSRIQEETDKFQEELHQLQQNKENSSLEIEDKEKQIQEIRTTIINSKELFEEIELKIQKLNSEKEVLTQKNKDFLAKREELSKHMADLDKESFRLTSKKEGFEETLEKQINYMWEEYEITYSKARELRNESFTDLSEIKRQIQLLKSDIRSLGSVNVNAIEDYKNVSERYAFLKTQYDDLVEAKETLIQIIEELDTAMRKQFAERFKEIASEFDKVFKQLFGGGKGTLELMEDEDILEAGIRIIAQPPGKKLQNMMQLSGGEKALTAISLLFAIQNLKPSPFCLLDEIEAALDDSNVTRFAQYLHKLTKNTQFIVITHRRGTMTAADRLYGITMQEKGVSTLVSVDLLEKDLTK
ncbi:chromosome segregation protein SMC [Faecalimonas canis]